MYKIEEELWNNSYTLSGRHPELVRFVPHLAGRIKLTPQRVMMYLQRSTFFSFAGGEVPSMCHKASTCVLEMHGAHDKEEIGHSGPGTASIPSRILQMGTGTSTADHCVRAPVMSHVIILCLNLTTLDSANKLSVKNKRTKRAGGNVHSANYTQLADRRDPDMFSFPASNDRYPPTASSVPQVSEPIMRGRGEWFVE